jgi:hypothetical protein
MLREFVLDKHHTSTCPPRNARQVINLIQCIAHQTEVGEYHYSPYKHHRDIGVSAKERQSKTDMES